MRWFLSAAALALACLFFVETAGIARALASDTATHCCCGGHRWSRPCRCRSCPASRKRTIADNQQLSCGDECARPDEPSALVPLSSPSPRHALPFVGYGERHAIWFPLDSYSSRSSSRPSAPS